MFNTSPADRLTITCSKMFNSGRQVLLLNNSDPNCLTALAGRKLFNNRDRDLGDK